MGKIRRSGYILEWYIGDHEPRYVHVYDGKHRLVGIEGWTPDRRLIKLVRDLINEGRL